VSPGIESLRSADLSWRVLAPPDPPDNGNDLNWKVTLDPVAKKAAEGPFDFAR